MRWYRIMFEEKQFGKIRYLVKYPAGYVPSKRYPTILFLHGAGTRGQDFEKLYGNPFFRITGGLTNFPFLVVAPLCDVDTWFDMFEDLCRMAEAVSRRQDADPERFYGVGLSMGGYGIWQLAMSKPDLFAAIIPICGGGMYWNSKRIAHMPIWAFHGDSDQSVATEETIKMVVKIRSFGGNPRLTIYENCGHDAWSATYANQEVFDWLLQQRLKTVHTDDDGFLDSEKYG